MKRRDSLTSTRGFTVIELLVAVSISAVLAGVMLTVATNTLGIWNRSNGKWATAGVASAVLDQVEADLTSAVFQSNGGAELAATVLTTSSNSGIWTNPSHFSKPTGPGNVAVTDADIGQCRFGTGGTWLRFFVGGTGASTNRGAVRAVAYQLVRRTQTTSTNSEAAYLLFRSIVTESNTLDAGYDITLNGYASASAIEGNAGNVNRPNLNQILADQVVDFGVRFYTTQGTQLVPLYPASGGAWSNASAALGYTARATPGVVSTSPFPDMAEVMVRVLTDEGVQQLRLYENPPTGFQSTETWWSLVEKYSHVYVRRVRMGTKGP